VVLVGPMGAGKTAVGRALARTWHLRFLDSDDAVEHLTGQSVAEVFQTEGEAAFRQVEHRAIRRSLASHRGVLALGGGALTNPDTAARLEVYRAAGGQVVFLDVSVEQAFARIGSLAERPLLAGPNPQQQWLSLAEQRRPAWQAAATLTVQTDHLTPIKAAQLITTRLA